MADQRLREMERAAAAGDADALAGTIRARQRQGDLPSHLVDLAAYCGDQPARVALGHCPACRRVPILKSEVLAGYAVGCRACGEMVPWPKRYSWTTFWVRGFAWYGREIPVRVALELAWSVLDYAGPDGHECRGAHPRLDHDIDCDRVLDVLNGLERLLRERPPWPKHREACEELADRLHHVGNVFALTWAAAPIFMAARIAPGSNPADLQPLLQGWRAAEAISFKTTDEARRRIARWALR